MSAPRRQRRHKAFAYISSAELAGAARSPSRRFRLCVAPPSSDFASVQHLQAPILPRFCFTNTEFVMFNLNRQIKSGIEPASCVDLVKHVKFNCPNLVFSGRYQGAEVRSVKKIGMVENQCELSMGMSGDFEMTIEDVWSTSSAAEACRSGPQTADVLASKKQTTPLFSVNKRQQRQQSSALNPYMAVIDQRPTTESFLMAINNIHICRGLVVVIKDIHIDIRIAVITDLDSTLTNLIRNFFS
ncbi:hypothetical protein LXL04_024243 [Taraxacum kok-saghyz]